MQVDATEETVSANYSRKFLWKLLNPMRHTFGLGNNKGSLDGQETAANLQ